MGKGRSKEDYLETILVIEIKRGEVRSVDVAEALDFSKASVSRAVAALAEEGLILFGGDKRIRLTDEGRKIAEQVYEKHCFFRKMLEEAGVEPGPAAEEACQIEHVVSDDAFDKLKRAYGHNHLNFEKQAGNQGQRGAPPTNHAFSHPQHTPQAKAAPDKAPLRYENETGLQQGLQGITGPPKAKEP